MGGFTVRTAPAVAAGVEIQFFEESGVDIGPDMQRQLERAYYRDDLRRAFHHDIGELNFPARGRDYYARGLLDSVDVEVIRARSPKLVVDYGWGSTTLTGAQVLGRIRGEVLAVNAVLDEERVVLSEEHSREHLEGLSRLVRSSGAELGALIDSPGERLHLVDGSGRIVEPSVALLAFASLIAQAEPSARVAVPVSTSRVAEDIVRRGGGEVVWTRLAPAGLMAAARAGDVAFAGDADGGYIFPSFLPSYDALMSLVKLLELLARVETDLRQVVEALPPSHISRREIPTPWEAKGAVMRRLLERLNGGNEGRLVTIDGLKSYRGEDWSLVVPHPQEPLVQIWAESGSDESAAELAEEMAQLVEELKT
jgi:mannose-1-phosphate guanylyltransferase/phosphomannomutase